MARLWIFCGALVGGLGVALGAYGAHGLEKQLTKLLEDSAVPAADRAENLALRTADFDTAVTWQMFHAPAIILAGIVAARRSILGHLASLFFLAGVILFSGLMYARVFNHPPLHEYLIPAGGISLILGWLALSFAGLCTRMADD